MEYETIVFLQGQEAQKALALVDEDHDKALNYLAQWDCGDSGDWYEVPPWEKADRQIRMGVYIITYNPRIGYISLTKLHPAGEAP